jgi:hypothetical protein
MVYLPVFSYNLFARRFQYDGSGSLEMILYIDLYFAIGRKQFTRGGDPATYIIIKIDLNGRT